MNIKVDQIGRLFALIGLGIGSLLPTQSAFSDTYRRPQVVQRRPQITRQQPRVVQRRPQVIRQQPRVVLKKPRVILNNKPQVVQRRPQVIRQQPRVVLKKPRVILNNKPRVVQQRSRVTLNNKSQVILNKKSYVIQRRPRVVLKKPANHYPHIIYQYPTNYYPYINYQQPIYQQPSYQQPNVIYQQSTKQVDTSEEQLEISIRYAHPEDVEQLHRVLFTSVRTLCANNYTPEQIETWIGKLDLDPPPNNVDKDGKVLLVAEDNEGVIVGFASLNKGEVNTVYVHPYYSWQEISALLLDALKVEAVAQNVEKLGVSASPTAVPFFETRGYQVVKQSSHNLGSGVQIPCVYMEQALLQTEDP